MGAEPALEVELGRRRTASDLVFARLRTAIIDGDLMPDERLTEVRLAKWLNISRTPLRQALQRLETEGWVNRTTTGAIRVGSVSDSEIDALYEVRTSLESSALRGAIQRIGAIELVNLRRNLADQKKALDAGDFSAATELSEAFHRSIWQLGGNMVCTEFLETINARTKRYRRIAFGGKANIGQGVVEHEQILDRIASKDVEGAEKQLAQHIEHSRVAVRSAFRNWKRWSD